LSRLNYVETGKAYTACMKDTPHVPLAPRCFLFFQKKNFCHADWGLAKGQQNNWTRYSFERMSNTVIARTSRVLFESVFAIEECQRTQLASLFGTA